MAVVGLTLEDLRSVLPKYPSGSPGFVLAPLWSWQILTFSLGLGVGDRGLTLGRPGFWGHLSVCAWTSLSAYLGK